MTYLIDKTGAVDQTWQSNYLPGESVKWLGDGTILRTIKTGLYGYGGAGGGVQKVLPDGTIAWDFRYDTNGKLSHHDVVVLPNGNVLMIAWETKTQTDAILAGRDPSNTTSQGLMPDHIIEVKPTGSTTGQIIWEWHIWDHIIQDFDPSKENYGVVGNHPELIDINYVADSTPDIMHTNSIDYNPIFDQILISVKNYNEIWVIDHSTTSAEAAGHTGGAHGQGGDILYRWGNPEAYRAGTSNDRKLFGQHDATWIKPGYPGEGNILIFNNGLYDPIPPITSYSTVDEITPPVNDIGEYHRGPSSAFGPESLTWRYITNPPTSFYSILYSGAERLKNGNTLICDGVGGRFFEVTPAGETIWDYTNPYPLPSLNNVFKCVYISDEEPPEYPNLHCSGSLSWSNVKPGQIVSGSFELQNIGGENSKLNWTINTSRINWGTWTFTPKSGDNLAVDDGKVYVQVSVVTPKEEKSEFTGYIRVENKDNPADFDFIPLYLQTAVDVHPFQLLIYRFFMKCINLFSEKIYTILQRFIELCNPHYFYHYTSL